MSFRFSEALIIHELFIHQFFCRFRFSRALVKNWEMGNRSEKQKKDGTARQREGGSVEQHWLFMESEGIHVVQDHASCIGMGTNLSDELVVTYFNYNIISNTLFIDFGFISSSVSPFSSRMLSKP